MEVLLSVVVSLLVQFSKNVWKLGEYQTLALLVGVSIVGALIYTALVEAGLWQTVLGILVLASSFYTLIVERFTKGSAIGKALGVH